MGHKLCFLNGGNFIELFKRNGDDFEDLYGYFQCLKFSMKERK